LLRQKNDFGPADRFAVEQDLSGDWDEFWSSGI